MATNPSLAFQVDDDLQTLCESLALSTTPSEVDLHGLRELLEDHTDDLKKLLDNPPKSDASRNKLKEGTVLHKLPQEAV